MLCISDAYLPTWANTPNLYYVAVQDHAFVWDESHSYVSKTSFNGCRKEYTVSNNPWNTENPFKRWHVGIIIVI